MRRRLPALVLASLLCLASACGRAGDLTGPDAAQPTSPHFDEVDGNGGTIGNGNLTGESSAGALGSGGWSGEGSPDTESQGGTGGGMANSEDNGGMGGSGG